MESAKTLVLLQNSWARTFNSARLFQRRPDYWLQALSRARSGKRLRELLGHDCFENPLFHFRNTTPLVADHSEIRLPPDLDYVRLMITHIQPHIIIACGKQAEEVALEIWEGRLLCVPHPACRVLTNSLYRRGKRLLIQDSFDRVALRQQRRRSKLEQFC